MPGPVAAVSGAVSVGTAKMIGFFLAICGNTLIACSLTLQKRAHNVLSDSSPHSYRDDHAQEHNNDDHHLHHHEHHPLEPRSPDTNSHFHSSVEDNFRDIELQLPSSTDNLSDQPPEIHDADNLVVVDFNTPPTSPSVPRTPPSSSTSTQNPTYHVLFNPTWWLGTLLMAAGEIGNFAAFAFAPASLVAPLGAWSVVLSAVLAHVFLHEHVSNTNLLGISLCITGAFLIGTSAPDVSTVEAQLDADAVTRLLVRLPFVLFILATLTATIILVIIAHRTTLGQQYIFVYVGVSSLLGSVTVVCAKALSTFLRITIEGNSQFGNWLPFALGFTLALAILAQLRYLNLAMAQFGNAQVIPVYYVLFTTCAMSSGVIMYHEFDQLTLRNLPFFLGICSTMSGVFLVSKSAKKELRTDRNWGNESNVGWRWSSNLKQVDDVLSVSPMSSPRSSNPAL